MLIYQLVKCIFYVFIADWVLVFGDAGSHLGLIRDHAVVKRVFSWLLCWFLKPLWVWLVHVFFVVLRTFERLLFVVLSARLFIRLDRGDHRALILFIAV